MKNVKVLWLVLCGFTLLTASGAIAMDNVLLQDSFDQYHSNTWEQQAADIAVADGKAVIKPKSGQVWLSSVKKYETVTLDARLKLNTLSKDSSIFYYLGFQSVKPWAYNTSWVTIHDNAMSAGIKKGDGEGITSHVADVVENTWYDLKIEWRADSVEIFLNGKSIFRTTDKAVIPTGKMQVFLAANTLAKQEAGMAKPEAGLEIDSVTVTGELPAVAGSEPNRADKPDIVLPIQQVGKAEDAIIKVADGMVRFENQMYICEFSLAHGLTWQKIYNKTVDVDYLMENDRSSIFMVQGQGFSLDSSTFDVSNITLSENVKSRTALILLVNKERNLEARLEFTLDDTSKILGTLTLKNNGMRAMKLQPIFPTMSRLKIGEKLEDTQYFFPWRSGVVGAMDCDLSSEYGNMAWMQVMSVFNPSVEGGLYVYPQDSSGGFKGLVLKKATVNPEATIRHSEIVSDRDIPKEDIFEFDQGLGFAYYYPQKEVAAGAEYAMPSTVISIYKGDWKPALKDYSAWAHTWYKHVGSPQWFKNCFNFVNRHTPGFWSDEQKKYIASENKLASASHISQWAFWEDCPNPYRTENPQFFTWQQHGDYKYHEARGGLKAFKNEIQRIQEKGGRFTVYINHRFCWSGSEIGKAHGREWATMTGPDGFLDLGAYAETGVDGWSMCFFEPNAWADYMAETCKRIIKDTGMDGIYLDELAIMYPCYNPSHKHFQEDKSPISPRRMSENITKVRNAIRSENPQAILMVEHAGSDYMSQFTDGSWTQTFYPAAFPFSEKYFDENSLIYFRFCFPEYKLSEWGDSVDKVNRCLFNGIGMDGVALTQGQVFKENGDGFASLSPEPLINTKAKKVLANKFSIANKTLFTLYNKNDTPFKGEILEVDPKTDYHYVELLHDEPVTVRFELVKSREVLTVDINANEVVCIAQLPQVIKVSRDGQMLNISLKDKTSGVLVAYLDLDTSHELGQGKIIELTNGNAQVDTEKLFGRKGKLILKLINDGLLIDQVVVR